MGTLSKAAILAAKDRRTERVSVPEWGGDVILRGLSVREASQVAAAWKRAGKKGGDADADEAAFLMLAFSLADEEGGRLFTESEAAELSEKSQPVVKMLLDRINALNGWDKEGNSDATTGDASSSA